MREYRSKIEQKNICRKCKVVFLSVDGSPCPNPECLKIDEELEVNESGSEQIKKKTKKEITRTKKQMDSEDTDTVGDDE